jgi:hypothetical protein
MTFTTTIVQEGGEATGIEVPRTYVEELGGGKRPPVVVTVNGGYSYRSTVVPYAGKILFPLAAVHRKAAGVKAGDTIEITLTLDTEPRTVDVPADLAEALDKSGTRAAFDKLSYTHRKEHVRAIEEAKAADTRQRRIAKAIDMLKR